MLIFGFLTARNKIHQIPHVIFGTKNLLFFFQTLVNIVSPFIFVPKNPSEMFQLKDYAFWTKTAHESTFFHTFGVL